jgi:hypothetical protein
VAVLIGIPVAGWSLSVSPGRTEIRLSPSQKAAGQLMLLNEEQVPVHVALSTKDWFVLNANQAKKLTVDSWLKLQGSKEFDLKPGEQRQVKFRAHCPKDAEGELVGMISCLYTTHGPAMVTPMISVSVYLQVAGTEKRTGDIEQLAVRTWNHQFQVAASVVSTGNVHLRPTGTFRIMRAGQEMASFLLKEGNPTYPGNRQGYFGDVPNGFHLDPGVYDLQADLMSGDLSLKKSRPFEVKSDGSIVMDSKEPEQKKAS